MTQGSREVLIELLFLSLYLDEVVSLAEDEVLAAALDSLGWESPTPREQFIFTAFSSAREVAAWPVAVEGFLAARTEQIRRDGEEATALTWLSRVITADGVAPAEQHFLSQLEAQLYPRAAAEATVFADSDGELLS